MKFGDNVLPVQFKKLPLQIALFLAVMITSASLTNRKNGIFNISGSGPELVTFRPLNNFSQLHYWKNFGENAPSEATVMT